MSMLIKKIEKVNRNSKKYCKKIKKGFEDATCPASN